MRTDVLDEAYFLKHNQEHSFEFKTNNVIIGKRCCNCYEIIF